MSPLNHVKTAVKCLLHNMLSNCSVAEQLQKESCCLPGVDHPSVSRTPSLYIRMLEVEHAAEMGNHVSFHLEVLQANCHPGSWGCFGRDGSPQARRAENSHCTGHNRL